MRFKLLFLFFFTICVVFTARSSSPIRQELRSSNNTHVVDDFSRDMNISMEDFVKLSPKEYEKLTGKHLKFKDRLKLRLTQKMLKHKLKKGESDIPQIGYILLSVFGWGFLAMGLIDDWTGDNWWICLLLTFAFVLPGVIFALIKMSEYY